MRQSTLFLKTQKEAPKDEVSVNAQLLLRGNFVSKLMAGVYTYLPLGFRVRDKVMRVIREEMDPLGAELLMPVLHPRTSWEPTGRWSTMEKIMFQFKDASGHEFGLGPTHEEIIAAIATQVISSYADLPLAVYQIQTKFRNEARAKSGLLRGREFTMKDLYSFHATKESLDEYYEKVKEAYLRIFKRCSLTSFVTEASGGDFSKEHSHEFMVETPAGEDETVLCRLCGYAENKEIATGKAGGQCVKCQEGVMEVVKTIEVGNIFKLGTKFSEPLGLTFKDTTGATHPVIMASYGIGIERLMGTIVEVHHDEKGICWPAAVAPMQVHLLSLGGSPAVAKEADRVYDTLLKEGIEVLYDDRSGASAGEKFIDADLLGLPLRVVVSEKTIVEEKVEVKRRTEKGAKLMKTKELVQLIQQ